MTASDSSPAASSLQMFKLQRDKTDSELPRGTTEPKQQKHLPFSSKTQVEMPTSLSSQWSSRCLKGLFSCCHTPTRGLSSITPGQLHGEGSVLWRRCQHKGANQRRH